MKVLKIVLIAIVIFLFGSMQSQAQVSLNLQIGTPPAWGPSGYDQERYYYLPDVEAYYDVQTSLFIYRSGFSWVHRAYLPRAYRNYDLYNGYKVVLSDYRGDRPYDRFKDHKIKYRKGFRGGEQHNIGQRPYNEHGHGDLGRDGHGNDHRTGDLHQEKGRGEGNNGKGNHKGKK